MRKRIAIPVLITPVLFHLMVGLALAVFPLWRRVDRDRFVGSPTIYVTSVEPREAVEHRAPPAIQFTPRLATREIVISPSQASVASRRFVHVEAASAKSPLTLAELDALPAPSDTPPRLQVNDRTAVTDAAEVARRASKQPRPRKAQPKPTAASVPMPASLGRAARKLPPDFSRNPPPTYPAIARQNSWEGVVWVRVVIDREGKVSHVKVVKSSGHAVLDAAAVNAIRQWRARPAKRFGKPVPSVEVQSIRFRL